MNFALELLLAFDFIIILSRQGFKAALLECNFNDSDDASKSISFDCSLDVDL